MKRVLVSLHGIHHVRIAPTADVINAPTGAEHPDIRHGPKAENGLEQRLKLLHAAANYGIN
jgi:hypothetical protein